MTAHPSHLLQPDGSYAETLGLEFDAIEPGLIIEHRPGFAVSWAEARYRATLAGDHAPLLVDRDFAQLAGEGSAEVSQTWVLSVLAAMTTRAFGRVVANLAWENVVFPAVVRDGDTLLAESTVLSKRASRSRPEQGVLRVATRGIVRGGREVCRYGRTLLVYRGSSGPHRDGGYV